MSINPDGHAPTSIRALIEQYIQGRLNDKLEKLAASNVAEREKLLIKYSPEVWLEDASLRISQLQLATHTPKQHHSGSKATPVFLQQAQAQHPYIGSAGMQLVPDVMGNAAVLDVFKLLRLEYLGKSLLDRMLAADSAFIAALAVEPTLAETRFQRFLAFSRMPEQLNAGRWAKQVYFPVANNEYHLLVLLYPSSLVHRAYHNIKNDRFSDESKQLRELRSKGKHAEQEIREYRDLLQHKFGGSKPQNISQLNSDRGGLMWLLASLPPVWNGSAISVPKQSSVFDGYLSNRAEVKPILNGLVRLYRGVPQVNNIDFRDQRDELIKQLVAAVIDMSLELQQSATAGWSIHNTQFSRAESYWLDYGYREELFEKEDEGRLTEDEVAWLQGYRQRDWHIEVSYTFGRWLNQILIERAKLIKIDDHEARVWALELQEKLQMLKEEFA